MSSRSALAWSKTRQRQELPERVGWLVRPLVMVQMCHQTALLWDACVTEDVGKDLDEQVEREW